MTTIWGFLLLAGDNNDEGVDGWTTESHFADPIAGDPYVRLYSDSQGSFANTVPIFDFPMNDSSCFTYRVKHFELDFDNHAGFQQSLSNDRLYLFQSDDELYLGLNRVLDDADTQTVSNNREGAGLCCVRLRWIGNNDV